MNDRSKYEAPYSSPFDTRAMYHSCQDENATVVNRGGVSRWLCNCPGGPYFAIDVREGRGRGEWRPIETAPQDRTILLGRRNELGKWRTMRGQWFSKAEIDDYWDCPDDCQEGWYETSVEADESPSCWPTTPTHWMALPEPPK